MPPEKAANIPDALLLCIYQIEVSQMSEQSWHDFRCQPLLDSIHVWKRPLDLQAPLFPPAGRLEIVSLP